MLLFPLNKLLTSSNKKIKQTTVESIKKIDDTNSKNIDSMSTVDVSEISDTDITSTNDYSQIKSYTEEDYKIEYIGKLLDRLGKYIYKSMLLIDRNITLEDVMGEVNILKEHVTQCAKDDIIQLFNTITLSHKDHMEQKHVKSVKKVFHKLISFFKTSTLSLTSIILLFNFECLNINAYVNLSIYYQDKSLSISLGNKNYDTYVKNIKDILYYNNPNYKNIDCSKFPKNMDILKKFLTTYKFDQIKKKNKFSFLRVQGVIKDIDLQECEANTYLPLLHILLCNLIKIGDWLPIDYSQSIKEIIEDIVENYHIDIDQITYITNIVNNLLEIASVNKVEERFLKNKQDFQKNKFLDIPVSYYDDYYANPLHSVKIDYQIFIKKYKDRINIIFELLEIQKILLSNCNNPLKNPLSKTQIFLLESVLYENDPITQSINVCWEEQAITDIYKLGDYLSFDKCNNNYNVNTVENLSLDPIGVFKSIPESSRKHCFTNLQNLYEVYKKNIQISLEQHTDSLREFGNIFNKYGPNGLVEFLKTKNSHHDTIKDLTKKYQVVTCVPIYFYDQKEMREHYIKAQILLKEFSNINNPSIFTDKRFTTEKIEDITDKFAQEVLIHHTITKPILSIASISSLLYDPIGNLQKSYGQQQIEIENLLEVLQITLHEQENLTGNHFETLCNKKDFVIRLISQQDNLNNSDTVDLSQVNKYFNNFPHNAIVDNDTHNGFKWIIGHLQSMVSKDVNSDDKSFYTLLLSLKDNQKIKQELFETQEKYIKTFLLEILENLNKQYYLEDFSVISPQDIPIIWNQLAIYQSLLLLLLNINDTANKCDQQLRTFNECMKSYSPHLQDFFQLSLDGYDNINGDNVNNDKQNWFIVNSQQAQMYKNRLNKCLNLFREKINIYNKQHYDVDDYILQLNFTGNVVNNKNYNQLIKNLLLELNQSIGFVNETILKKQATDTKLQQFINSNELLDIPDVHNKLNQLIKDIIHIPPEELVLENTSNDQLSTNRGGLIWFQWIMRANFPQSHNENLIDKLVYLNFFTNSLRNHHKGSRKSTYTMEHIAQRLITSKPQNKIKNLFWKLGKFSITYGTMLILLPICITNHIQVSYNKKLKKYKKDNQKKLDQMSQEENNKLKQEKASHETRDYDPFRAQPQKIHYGDFNSQETLLVNRKNSILSKSQELLSQTESDSLQDLLSNVDSKKKDNNKNSNSSESGTTHTDKS